VQNMKRIAKALYSFSALLFSVSHQIKDPAFA